MTGLTDMCITTMPDAVLRTLQIFTHRMLLQLRAGDKLSSVLQMRILCQRGQVTYLMSHSRWVTEPGFKPRPPGSRNCKIIWKRKMWRLSARRNKEFQSLGRKTNEKHSDVHIKHQRQRGPIHFWKIQFQRAMASLRPQSLWLLVGKQSCRSTSGK